MTTPSNDRAVAAGLSVAIETIELNPRQAANYTRLREYYPYRMFFLVADPRDPQDELQVWAVRDKRQINRVLREGGTVLQIDRCEVENRGRRSPDDVAVTALARAGGDL